MSDFLQLQNNNESLKVITKYWRQTDLMFFNQND